MNLQGSAGTPKTRKATWVIHGHAIVSNDDCIAAADGRVPASLRNNADWRRFQTALDAAAVTVVGRRGHIANPNVKGRNRLVLSSSARGVERRNDAWWWNPREADADEALRQAAPKGGVVAVTGGRRVFDLFLSYGFDAFFLARARGVLIPGGIPAFSGIGADLSMDTMLDSHGLVAARPEILDPARGVDLVVWRRRTAVGPVPASA